jgi:hypothetical protein
MTRDGSGSGRSTGRSPVEGPGGLPGQDDPELDEILAAFQRPARAPSAVVAFSKLVAEPTPLSPEPTGRDDETVVLPRTRDRQRRRRTRTAIAAAALVGLGLTGALWSALRPRARPASSPSEGSAASMVPRTAGVGGQPQMRSSFAAPGASPSGGPASVEVSSARPAGEASAIPPASPSADRDVPAPARRLPTASPRGSNLDPEFKRSM